MTVVTAWTIIACTLLVCLTATTIAGLIVGNRKPKEEFRVRDMPMPEDMPMPARMKNRKLD